jgi:hypothetical protein
MSSESVEQSIRQVVFFRACQIKNFQDEGAGIVLSC